MNLATKNLVIKATNRLIRNFAAITNGVILADLHAGMVDNSSSTPNTEGAGLAAYFQTDGIHPSNFGAYQMGTIIKNAILSVSTVPSYPLIDSSYWSNSNVTGYDALSNNLIPNPLFIAGTGGSTTSTGGTMSGAAAQNWTANLLTTGTAVVCTASIVARTLASDGDAIGNNQVITFTSGASAAGDTMNIINNASYVAGMVSAGQWVVFEFSCKWNFQNAATLSGFVGYVYFIIDGVVHTSYVNYSYQPTFNPSFNGVLRSQPVKIPSYTTISGINAQVTAKLTSTAATTGDYISIGRAQVRIENSINDIL